MDASQVQQYLIDPLSFVILVVGGVVQLLLLGLWHRVRPWGVVVVRTILVQVLLVLAMTLLAMRWPFSFSAVYKGIPLVIAVPEALVALWYLLQRRGGGGYYGDDDD